MDDPDPVFARQLQQAIGGVEGEIRVAMQYLFQGFGARGPKRSGTCSWRPAPRNPNGPQAGTCFFGGPQPTGPIDGLQAGYARIPYANVGSVRLSENVTDDDAILISDIFPTAYFGADIAGVKDGDTVAVFGLGAVGQFAVLSAFIMDAGRVLAVDREESRLEAARAQGAEVVNFEREDPVEAIFALTGGIGVDRVIEAVGVDAEHAHSGPAAPAEQHRERRSSRRWARRRRRRTHREISGGPAAPRSSPWRGPRRP